MELKVACAVAMTAVSLLGCSVHAQAPIKAVAYDFSDRDFYDRSYAPSPDYGDGPAPADPRVEPAALPATASTPSPAAPQAAPRSAPPEPVPVAAAGLAICAAPTQ